MHIVSSFCCHPTISTDGRQKMGDSLPPVSVSTSPPAKETAAVADEVDSSCKEGATSSAQTETKASTKGEEISGLHKDITTDSTGEVSSLQAETTTNSRRRELTKLNKEEKTEGAQSPNTESATHRKKDVFSRLHKDERGEHYTYPPNGFSGLMFASVAFPSSSGLVCEVDVFGDVTGKVVDDLTCHMERLIDWLRRQAQKYGAKEDNMAASVICSTNSKQDQLMLREGLERFGFTAREYPANEIYYFWQSFQSLKSL